MQARRRVSRTRRHIGTSLQSSSDIELLPRLVEAAVDRQRDQQHEDDQEKGGRACHRGFNLGRSLRMISRARCRAGLGGTRGIKCAPRSRRRRPRTRTQPRRDSGNDVNDRLRTSDVHCNRLAVRAYQQHTRSDRGRCWTGVKLADLQRSDVKNEGLTKLVAT